MSIIARCQICAAYVFRLAPFIWCLRNPSLCVLNRSSNRCSVRPARTVPPLRALGGITAVSRCAARWRRAVERCATVECATAACMAAAVGTGGPQLPSSTQVNRCAISKYRWFLVDKSFATRNLTKPRQPPDSFLRGPPKSIASLFVNRLYLQFDLQLLVMMAAAEVSSSNFLPPPPTLPDSFAVPGHCDRTAAGRVKG